MTWVTVAKFLKCTVWCEAWFLWGSSLASLQQILCKTDTRSNKHINQHVFWFGNKYTCGLSSLCRITKRYGPILWLVTCPCSAGGPGVALCYLGASSGLALNPDPSPWLPPAGILCFSGLSKRAFWPNIALFQKPSRLCGWRQVVTGRIKKSSVPKHYKWIYPTLGLDFTSKKLENYHLNNSEVITTIA